MPATHAPQIRIDVPEAWFELPELEYLQVGTRAGFTAAELGAARTLHDHVAHVRMVARIYFAQAEGGGPIKVGHALNAQTRLEGIQAGNPQRLVLRRVVLTPEVRYESAFHYHYRRYRLCGEWFQAVPSLAVIADAIPDPAFADAVVPAPPFLDKLAEDDGRTLYRSC